MKRKVNTQLLFISFFIIFMGLFSFKKTKQSNKIKEAYSRVGAREYIKDQNNINHNDTALALGSRGNTIYIPNNVLYQDEKMQWYNYW